MAKTFNQKSFIIATLRRASFRHPARTEALRAARIDRGLYKCAICSGTFKNKEIRVDHKNPVVDVKTGFVDWNTYIERLFCDSKDLQIVCEQCHASKSAVEKELRKHYRPKPVKKLNKKRLKD